ncbi:MAG: ArsC/Spx/MgsR family protein [Gammaproteobacteria bacterium]
MAVVYFYEKPGCINNTRQKKILAAAGHQVVAHNLLTTPWSRDELSQFFAGLPVAEWFNRSAPAIKNGTVDPERLSAEQALSLMLAEPLLIRRPLLHVDDEYHAGFDLPLLETWIGLTTGGTEEDLENCPRERQQQGA